MNIIIVIIIIIIIINCKEHFFCAPYSTAFEKLTVVNESLLSHSF
jgi:hypothetical protein